MSQFDIPFSHQNIVQQQSIEFALHDIEIIMYFYDEFHLNDALNWHLPNEFYYLFSMAFISSVCVYCLVLRF